MFDLNFISEPGIQNDSSNANWSFLNNNNEPENNGESYSKKSITSFTQQNSWKNYALILSLLGFIVFIAILNRRYIHVKPDLLVLNQVIALIDECSYINTLQLEEANFSTNQVTFTIRSTDFAAIQSLSQDYPMQNEILYEMYQKGKFSYFNLIFPWKGNEKSGDITILKSIADNTIFSNNISTNHTKNIFEIQGESSDIISFLLKMAENKQLQKFNFSVVQQDSGQFNLKVQLHLI